MTRRRLHDSYLSKRRDLLKLIPRAKIPKPDTPSHRGLITRMHKYVTRRMKSGQRQIVRLSPDDAKIARRVFLNVDYKALGNIAIVPRGKLHVNRDGSVSIVRKHETQRHFPMRARTFARNPAASARETLAPLKLRRNQVIKLHFGGHALRGAFTKSTVPDEIERLINFYGKRAVSRISFRIVTLTNQRSATREELRKLRRHRRRD